MFKIFSKTWGEINSPQVKIQPHMIVAVDSTRNDRPFFPQGVMIPLHDVTLIVPPEGE